MSGRGFISHVDPVIRKSELASKWEQALIDTFFAYGNPAEIEILRSVAPIDKEPVQIHLNVKGDYDSAAKFCNRRLPGTALQQKIELRVNTSTGKKESQTSTYLEIPQETLLPAQRPRFYIPPLTPRETFWLLFSILVFAVSLFCLCRHWSGFHRPWIGLLDLPYRLLTYPWRA